MPSRTRAAQYYPIADRLNAMERESLGLDPKDFNKPLPQGQRIVARRTGNYREPKAGEWYLSGAIVEAYRAPNDLSTPYHIARLVRVEEQVTVVIKEL